MKHVVALPAFVLLFIVFARLLERAETITIAPRTLTRPAAQPGHATLLFVGDTGLGDAAEPTLRREGYEYPFRATIDLVQGADVAIANLEMPITAGGAKFPLWKEYTYRSSPEAARALAWAGFDVLDLANNHAVDYGVSGLVDTIVNADRAELATFGAGPDEREARRGLVVKIGDAKVGLLGYCEHQLLWDLYVDQFARGDRGGTAALTERALTDDIARLRPLVDVLVVQLHIGDNYAPPTARALDWSRRAIDLGADLVVNHHPHVAHPMTMEKGRAIALSLGNYAFGTPGHDDLDYGLLLFAQIEGKRLARIELVPIATQNERVAYRPTALAGAELDGVLGTLIADSHALGARLERVDDRAVLRLPR